MKLDNQAPKQNKVLTLADRELILLNRVLIAALIHAEQLTEPERTFAHNLQELIHNSRDLG